MMQINTCFSAQPWSLGEQALHADALVLAETLFSLGSGYLGTRGTFEEGLAGVEASREGTYLNGLYFSQPIHYEEDAYGFARNNHKLIQAPDGKRIDIFIDGEAFVPSVNDVISHQRQLDFKTGLLTRKTVYLVSGKGELEITCRRLVSLKYQHAMAIDYQCQPIDFSCDLTLRSGLDAVYGGSAITEEFDPRAGDLSIRKSLDQLHSDAGEEQLTFLHRIANSEKLIGSACRHVCEVTGRSGCEENYLYQEFTSHIKAGEAFSLGKRVAYHDADISQTEHLLSELSDTLDVLPDFNALAEAQSQELEIFWANADIAIDGDIPSQQGIRFNLFHILQSTGRDGRRAIAAKGLSGPGYDGHYFWDTEIYIIPFYVFSQPEIARALLQFRVSLLDASRERARQMGHNKGALYAWRTIGGEECSAFFPAGTAQYHINAAIAYALRQYFDATQDLDLFKDGAAEMLFETARIWAEIGHFSQAKDGQFCINEVTGPDEYSAMVDNNFYTNAMARMHFRFAVEMARILQSDLPDVWRKLTKKIGLEQAETADWERAAEAMYLPYDTKNDIHPQDDGFLGKPVWDFANTPKEHYPLLLHYHPLTIYRHRVIKQADVVLAMALLGKEFDDRTRRNNLAFYTPLTTHDSTLSTCIYSIESARAGQMEEAYNLFDATARMDLDNRHHNTEYGLHTACMAGSWAVIVNGFAGMQAGGGVLSFTPRLPENWQGYQFQVTYRGCQLRMQVNSNEVICELIAGDKLTIELYGTPIELKKEKPHNISGYAKE